MNLTPLQNLYDAFFVLMESDEWETWTEEEIGSDLYALFQAAVPWFKFPRCSLDLIELDIDGISTLFFSDEKISNIEIQILALFMKDIWYGRVIDSWENLRPLYTERDFSPASQLKQFEGRQETIRAKAKDLERIYSRSVKGKPFNYKRLAGGK